MSRGARPLVFVCGNILEGELAMKMIVASSPGEASSLYKEQFGILPKEVLGPFFKKKTQVMEVTRSLKFATGICKKAHYGDWMVNAFVLVDPPDQAYLVFCNRTDGKKVPAPTGTIVVPITELRFI